MKTMNRRRFLHKTVISAGALALSQFLNSCGQKEIPTPTNTAQPSQPAAAFTSTPLPASPTFTVKPPTALPTITNTVPASTPTTPPTPDLVVARGGQPEDMVRRAIAALGGMNRFVAKGSNVIIKPNICVGYYTFEYAATTNPWVVGALIKLCFESGAKTVKVMDFPFGSPAKEAYAKSGIEEQVKACGGEMVQMPAYKFVTTDIPKGKLLKRADIYDDILKADVVINVPIAKNHGLATLTLGLKNLMGVVRDRGVLHTGLGQNLADLYTKVHPAITIIDAVRILMRNGPSGGNLSDVKKMDTIIASTDIVAADSYAAGLFNIKPESLDYIRAGVAMGIGRSDINNMRIEEISVGG